MVSMSTVWVRSGWRATADLRLEQRPARQHRHVGAGAAGVEGDEVLDALDVAEMAAADDAGDRAGHHGLDRRARQHRGARRAAVRFHHQRARASESAAARALRASRR